MNVCPYYIEAIIRVFIVIVLEMIEVGRYTSLVEKLVGIIDGKVMVLRMFYPYNVNAIIKALIVLV